MTSSPEREDGALAAAASLAAETSDFARARSEALNIVQWLARIAHSYVTSGAAERRTELDFRAEDTAFVTKTFADGVALEMRLPDLHLQFLHNGKPVPHVFDPQERSPAEAEAWILVELLHRGIERQTFSKKLPYAIAGLLTGDACDYMPQDCRAALVELATVLRKAAAILKEAARASGAEPTIIGLPQTLGLALAPLPGAIAGTLGFSPGDAENPAAFFYADDGASAAKPKRTVIDAGPLLGEDVPARAAAKLLALAAR